MSQWEHERRDGWIRRHPTATLRIITLGLSAGLFYRASMIDGNPEASLMVGCVAAVLVVVSTVRIETC